MAYLSGSAPFDNREEHPLPCLFLLDLSMPGKHGPEVLKWLHGQPALSSIPSVVLSSSNQESDIHTASTLGANGFLIKPGEPEELLQIVTGLGELLARRNPPRRNFRGICKNGGLAPKA